MTTTIRPGPDRAGGRRIAVVDLGSNSIRLVIYDGLARAPVSRFNERRLCGLGREVARHGRLGPDGRACALEALGRFVAIARGAGCGTIDVLATAAVRGAADGGAFVGEAEAGLGLPIDVLSGEEEARYGAQGILCGFRAPEGVVGDLGGGSVEFAAVPLGAPPPERPASLPLGALVLADAVAHDPKGCERLIADRLAGVPDLKGCARGRAFFVVGGSWRALARTRMSMLDDPLRVVHGYEISAAEAETLGQSVAGLDVQELARMPGVPRRRAETIPAAALLLGAVVRHLEPDRVIFSATGLREGRLFAMLDVATRAQDPLLAGAEELGRAGNREPGIGAAMARFTDGVLPDETPARRRLRLAACHVADTAWREHPDARAREAFHRLAQYPFLGITHRERVALAHAVFVRYEGTRGDPTLRRTLLLLDEAELAWTRALGQALELGIRVSGGVPAIAAACGLAREGGLLKLAARHPAVGPRDEAIQTRLRALAASLGLEGALAAA